MLRLEATLVCSFCGTQRLNIVTDEELDRLKGGHFLKLICDQCHIVTDWGLLVEDRRWILNRRQTSERRRGSDKREHGRVRIGMPVEFRCFVGGSEYCEKTTTVNISRSGIYFLTNEQLRLGQEMTVILAPALVHDPNNPVLKGRIVRIDEGDREPRRGVVVYFEGIKLDI